MNRQLSINHHLVLVFIYRHIKSNDDPIANQFNIDNAIENSVIIGMQRLVQDGNQDVHSIINQLAIDKYIIVDDVDDRGSIAIVQYQLSLTVEGLLLAQRLDTVLR